MSEKRELDLFNYFIKTLTRLVGCLILFILLVVMILGMIVFVALVESCVRNLPPTLVPM